MSLTNSLARIASLLTAILGCGAALSYADVSEATPWSPYDKAVISFEVLRNGSAFGDHIVSFKREDAKTFKVITDVDLKAGLGPISLYRYRLDAQETWRDGELVALSGVNNDDGDKARVTAERQGDSLRVQGSAYKGIAPADIIPSSHWNIRQMYSDTMLSTEDGHLMPIDIEVLGSETVQVGGRSIPATRYRLKSDIAVDLWYDDEGRWVKLAFQARGQHIEYRLRAPY